MSKRPKSHHSKHSDIFVPDPALNNPLRVSTATQFDNLLHSAVGQKMFSRPASNYRSSKVTVVKSEQLSSTSAFLCKMQNSGSRTGLKVSTSNKTLETFIEKAHKEVTDINNQLKDVQKRHENDLNMLGDILSPERRKNLIEGLKETQKRCKSLKDARMMIIKRQRIIKNECPEMKGFEVYNWQDLKRREKVQKMQVDKKETRLRRLSTIHFVDPALSLKQDDKGQTEAKRGLKRLSSTMPHHYHDTSEIFIPASPVINLSRHKNLSDISHGKRDFNIITGTYLK